MKRYEEDDNMTCYFIIDERNNIIRGWTDNKEYAKLYLDFHKCKYYKIKKITNTFREVLKIIEENSNDEISIYNINTRSNKKHESSKDIAVPLTETEGMLINEEANTFLSSRVNYTFINEAFYYLKGKYQKALKSIMLEDVMKNVIYSKRSKIVLDLEIDELLVLFHSIPDQFGE